MNSVPGFLKESNLHGVISMNDKPPAEILDIPGLRYIPEFIDGDLEARLIAHIDAGMWDNSLKRRVQHYGYRYDYQARRVNRSDFLGPLPPWISALSERLFSTDIFRTEPDQVIINEYLPGQGIAPHIDCAPCFGGIIASLSLGSGCVMNFSEPRSDRKESLFLNSRSLIIFSNEARYQWRHSIAARKSDMICGERVLRNRRLSLTFRNVLDD